MPPPARTGDGASAGIAGGTGLIFGFPQLVRVVADEAGMGARGAAEEISGLIKSRLKLLATR